MFLANMAKDPTGNKINKAEEKEFHKIRIMNNLMKKVKQNIYHKYVNHLPLKKQVNKMIQCEHHEEMRANIKHFIDTKEKSHKII